MCAPDGACAVSAYEQHANSAGRRTKGLYMSGDMDVFVDTSVVTTDAKTGAPIQCRSFTIRRTPPNNEAAGATNLPDGFASFWCKADRPGLPQAFLNVSADGYQPIVNQPINITVGMGMIRCALEPVALPRPSRADMLNVRANFCNIYDPTNMLPMFTAYLPVKPEWLQPLVDAGSTHVTYSPECAYPGYWVPPFDWRDRPDDFAAFTVKVTQTRGANGQALTPVIFLDNGGTDPLPRIQRYWPNLINSLRSAGVLDRCILVPAWEPVKGDWTSYELSEALKYLKALANEAIIGWHGSPTRWVGSSHPVEPTDPWQGGESDFYKSHGGEFIDIAFYQAQAESVFQGACNPQDDDCWLNRWLDGVIRLGRGVNGWRVLPICLAEGPAYYFTRGKATPEQARLWATNGDAVAKAEGVTVSFINGLPL